MHHGFPRFVLGLKNVNAFVVDLVQLLHIHCVILCFVGLASVCMRVQRGLAALVYCAKKR